MSQNTASLVKYNTPILVNTTGGAKGKKKKARRKINPSLLSHLENRQGESPRLAAPGLRQADDVLAWGSGGGVEGGVVGWAASPRVASRPGARRPRRVRHGRLMMTPHRRTNAHGRRPRARRAARDGGPPPRPCAPPRASLTPAMRPILSSSYLSAVGARPPSGCRSGSPTRAQPPRPPAVCKRQAPQTQRTRCRLVRRAPS